MLAKRYRFHGYGSLRFLYNRGKTVRSRFIGLKFVANPRRQDCRLAVVVTKKISKKAPLRNLMRRRLYEVMRLQWPMILPGHDIILTVFDAEISQLTPGQLNKLIVGLLVKADIYKH